MSGSVTPRGRQPGQSIADLPTVPRSVVWSGGHAYVLERVRGRARWVGVDDRGRPQELSGAELCHRGWSHSRP
ncbi:MAG TPA: hypothetical protein VF444_10375 [Pseudonocardiaceae bacterium]